MGAGREDENCCRDLYNYTAKARSEIFVRLKIHFITMYRCNRKHEHSSKKVVTDLSLKTKTLAERPARRVGKKRKAESGIVQRGGKISKAAREGREARKEAIKENIEEKKKK